MLLVQFFVDVRITVITKGGFILCVEPVSQFSWRRVATNADVSNVYIFKCNFHEGIYEHHRMAVSIGENRELEALIKPPKNGR